MIMPQLIFGWISVGVQPVERFPRWIQGFVRDQFTSQFVYALRALAGDSTPAAGAVSWSVIGPAILWLAVYVAVAIALYARVSGRRR
jgi:ABC-2 type transport system permease protein